MRQAGAVSGLPRNEQRGKGMILRRAARHHVLQHGYTDLVHVRHRDGDRGDGGNIHLRQRDIVKSAYADILGNAQSLPVQSADDTGSQHIVFTQHGIRSVCPLRNGFGGVIARLKSEFAVEDLFP